jgi:hypothetical protein
MSSDGGGGGDASSFAGGGKGGGADTSTGIGADGSITPPSIIPTGPGTFGPNTSGPSPADLTAGAGVGSPFGAPDLTPTSTAGPSFDQLLSAPPANTVAGGFDSLPGMTTSNASLNTSGVQPGASTAPVLGGSGAAPNFSQLTAGVNGTTPVAAGASSFGGPAAAPTIPGGPTLSAPGGATSLAPAAAGAAPTDATSSWSDMLKKGLTSNPLGAAIAAGGLGYNIYQGQKTTANQQALLDVAKTAQTNNKAMTDAGVAQVGANQANAAPVLATGEKLIDPLATGNLPPQYQSIVDNAINDAKTNAISNAAKNGQNTDPTQNTALAQQLAQIDNQRSSMTAQVAQQLASTGSGLVNAGLGVGNASASSLLSGGQNAAGLSGQLYSTLTNLDNTQAQQTAKAIAALAQSLNGGTPTAAPKAA